MQFELVCVLGRNLGSASAGVLSLPFLQGQITNRYELGFTALATGGFYDDAAIFEAAKTAWWAKQKGKSQSKKSTTVSKKTTGRKPMSAAMRKKLVISELFESGATGVHIHSGQRDQARLIDFYGKEVLPRLRKSSSQKAA